MVNTKYHLLLCEPLDGEEAERIGLVSLCVDDAELHGRALEVAGPPGRRVADGAALDQVGAQQLAAHGRPTFDASLALEFLGFSGPDLREGVAAFRAKRRPDLTGPA